MKKSIVVLSVLGAFSYAAHAQTNVTVYGLLDSGVTYVNKIAAPTAANARGTGSRFSVDSGDLQQSRFGFKGVEDLGGGMKALFNLEGGFSVDTGASGQGGLVFGRTSTVGLSGNYGTVQLGRRKDFIDEVATYYSSVYDFGVFINGVHDNNLDRVGGNRANNQIRYDTPLLKGLVLNATYGFGETAGSTSTGQSLGFGANYANGPFGIGFGYWQSKLGTLSGGVNTSSDQGTTLGAGCTPSYGHPGDTCIKTWMLGTSYKAGPWRVFGAWSKVLQPLATYGGNRAPLAAKFVGAAGAAPFAAGGANNNNTNVFDLGVDYSISDSLRLVSSVLQSRYEFVGSSTKGRLTQFNLGLDYAFSKRTDLYSYVANLRASDMYNPGITGGAPGADNSQTAFTVGLRHKF
ncbi:porin [Collimonas antrihumi]|uniref:porin n=1 Tax=Collimonas antrihumi TaxID=1940615 RepID=UPI001B8B4E55|nr:porin [Collimonas antrihumi]